VSPPETAGGLSTVPRCPDEDSSTRSTAARLRSLLTGATTVTGALAANGGITCDTDKFVVADTTGNTTIAGTLAVTGASTLTGALAANGGITCDTDKFTVADTTGDTTVAGTLGVTGVITATAGVTGDLTGNVTATSVLVDGVTATTQPSGTDNTTVATTAFAVALSHVPAGAITQYGAASAPTGWLLCDGTAKSRTTYSALFAIISTTYGVGDGSSTFNLPDLQGNVPVGKDSSTFGSLGDTGGAETHALSEAELAAHTHFNFADVASTDGTVSAETQPNRASSTGLSYYEYKIQGSSTAATLGKSSSVGLGTAHQNLQPYLVINYIIKT